MKKSSHLSSKYFLRFLPILLVFFLPMLAHAHTGMGQTGGFGPGASHPIAGLDHICAMVAVGVWAAQRGGRAIWFVPLIFVSIMALGGLLGMAGVFIPLVEQGIVASVFILGILIAASVRLPITASVVIISMFAFLHGHAHGSEMPELASGLTYGLGFMFSTAFLHICGIGFGLLAQRLGSMQLVRYAGVVIAACGIYLCLG